MSEQLRKAIDATNHMPDAEAIPEMCVLLNRNVYTTELLREVRAWVTSKENHEQRRSHGRVCFGENHGSTKISEATARAVLAAIQDGQKERDVASRFGISKSLAHDIKSGKRWAHIQRATNEPHGT